MFRSKKEKGFLSFKTSTLKKRFRIDSNLWKMKYNLDICDFFDILKEFYKFPICITESCSSKEQFEITFYDDDRKNGKLILFPTYLNVVVDNKYDQRMYKYIIVDNSKKVILKKLEINNFEIFTICRYYKNNIFLNIKHSNYEVRILKKCSYRDETIFEKIENIDKNMIFNSKLILKLIFKEYDFTYETVQIKTFYKKRMFSAIDIKEGILNSYKYSIDENTFIDSNINGISVEYFLLCQD